MINTVLGKYTGTEIICSNGEIIKARAYASKHEQWLNKYGFWNLNEFNFPCEWKIIMELFELDETQLSEYK